VRSERIELPDLERDRPRPWLVLAVALSAASAGLAAAYGLTRPQPSQPSAGSAAQPNVPSERRSADASPADASTTDASAAEVRIVATRAPLDAGHVAPAREEVAREPPEVVPATETGAPTTEVTAGPTEVTAAPTEVTAPRVRRGFVAYAHCDGLPLGPGRFPCPRDLELEQRVFRILDQLAQCAPLQGQRGEGEIRLEFGREGIATLKMGRRERNGPDPKAVGNCAGRALRGVRTRLQPDRMLVRFRFELQ
jgi:hypothetical protein